MCIRDREYTVEELTEHSFDKPIDIALFSAGGSTSEKYAPIAAEHGVKMCIRDSCKSEYDKDGSLKIRSSFPDDNGHPMVDGYMEKINALAYYNAGGYVYYITLGDLEGVHRMLFDGSEDIILQNLDGMEIGANTKVSITYNGCLLYTSRCV